MLGVFYMILWACDIVIAIVEFDIVSVWVCVRFENSNNKNKNSNNKNNNSIIKMKMNDYF